MIIDSKYAGKCATCGKPYKAGDRIEWTRENGAHHEKCAPSNSMFQLFDIAAAEALADALGFDDVPGRNKRRWAD